MTTRSHRPSSISNRADGNPRAYPSIDNDFAPSVTPSSAESDFPRLYKYHPPKDKTWWPKRNPMASPDPADPTLPKTLRKTSDPTYKPRRRSTRTRSSTSSAEGLRAVTKALKKQTRIGGVKKQRVSGKSRTEPSHASKDTINAKSRHCVLKKTPPASPQFNRPNYNPNYNHVRANMKAGDTGSNVVTLDQLPRPPPSPKNWKPYKTQEWLGNKKLDATATLVAKGSKDSPTTRKASESSGLRPSAAESLGRIVAAEKRSSFERRHGLGNRLGSFDSFGMLTPPFTPLTTTSTGKRKLSDVVEEDGSGVSKGKRSRHNGGHFTTGEIDQIALLLAEQAKTIRHQPESLTLEHVGPLFNYLTGSVRSFSNVHFSFTLTQEQREAWPLHQLSSSYLPLMLVAQYIADGSQYGWRNFFTTPASRAALVSGVIGEWVRQRLFNHTCFGMSAENVEKLENMDREYLHHDAFLRSKKRSTMVQDMLKEDPSGCSRALLEAVQELAEELMTVLTPLMPDSIFAYCENGRHFYEDTSSRAAVSARQEIKTGLTSIIAEAARLHRAIRVMSKDGTIVRIANAVQKGERYFESAPFEIINDKMVKDTKHHGLKAEGKKVQEGILKIKMTCFPRVEAYVPHGPDYEQMVKKELRERQTLKDGEELDWDKVAGFWPDLPEEIVREQERDHGKDNVRKHGSYVTIYPRLAPHQVYCEWMPPQLGKKVAFKDDEVVAFDNEEDKDDGYQPTRMLNVAEQHANRTLGEPLPKIQRISLKEAVQQARNEAGWFKHTFEDGLRTTWNGFCRWEGPAELALTVGGLSWFVYSWYRTGILPGYQCFRNLGLESREGWEQLGPAAQAKLLGISEKALKGMYKALGKVEEAGKEGRRVTKSLIEEVKEAGIVAAASVSVHGVVPRSD